MGSPRRGQPRALQPAPDKLLPKAFKAYVPGVVYVDVRSLAQMADEDRRRYLFAVIDRTTAGWTRPSIGPDGCLAPLATVAPFRIRKLLTDNGTAFTDRLFGARALASSGPHEFDRSCQDLGIERRLTPSATGRPMARPRAANT